MNATPPVSQTPIASDPAQISGPASVNSVTSGGKRADFAAALCKAGAKPNRKPAPSMAGSGAAGYSPDGGQLPGTGNLSPPPTVSAGTTGAAPDAVSSGRLGSVGDSGSAAAMGPSDGAATAAPGTAQIAAVTPGLAPTLTFSLDLLAGAGKPGAGEPASQKADAAALAGAASTAATPAAATPAVATPAAATLDVGVAAERATVPGGASVGGRAAITTGTSPRASLTAASAVAANAAATSASSGASGSAAAQANATASDPSSLGATAAVMGAATGAVAESQATVDSTLSPAIDSATPAAGSAAVAAGANGAPAPGLPVPAGRPAAAAATATAASTAAVATASAGTIGTDKHAHSDSGDSLLLDVSAGSAGAAQLSVNAAGAAAPGATDAAAPPTLKVTAGVDSAEFGQGLADRLSWMVDNNLSSAKLQVNPPQLGPIEVRIVLQGNHAQVWLTSHSAVTRDALESSSPKLREMLGAQGFGQVSVDISQRNFQERSAYAQPYERSSVATAGSPAVSAVAAALPRLSNGAVDAYA